MTSRFNCGESLRYAQAKTRTSSKQIASHFGVDNATVYRWRNQPDMPVSRAAELSSLMGLNLLDFISMGENR